MLILNLLAPLVKKCKTLFNGNKFIKTPKQASNPIVPGNAKSNSSFLLSMFIGSCIEQIMSITPSRSPSFRAILSSFERKGGKILKFENVLEVHSKNINQLKKDKFLDFLAIESSKMPDNNHLMKVIFAGDSMIKVISEVIEVTLDDQGDAWDTKNKPKHKNF